MAFDLCIKKQRNKNEACKEYMPIPRMPPITPPKFTPLNDMKEAATLAEQLNGLLSNYSVIFNAYRQVMFTQNEKITESVSNVLANLEKAIEAICLRLTKTQVIVNTESNTTQHF